MQRILEEGVDRPNRTGVDTRALFGETLKFDLSAGFPAVTTKRLAFKSVVAELLWFLSGSRSVKDLQAMGCHIWNQNAEADYWVNNPNNPASNLYYRQKDGLWYVGQVYGPQWRSWEGWDTVGGGYIDSYGEPLERLDQIANLIDGLKKDPFDRRHIVTAWNPRDVVNKRMCLPPCHILFQCHVAPGCCGPENSAPCLHLEMYQRSCDLFLGVPFNTASYALLTHMLAQVCEYRPGMLIMHLADVHIYHSHFDQCREQLSREPFSLPSLRLNLERKSIDYFQLGDFGLEGYQHHPAIKAGMVV